MSAFPESGRSGTPKTAGIKVRFRHEADVIWLDLAREYIAKTGHTRTVELVPLVSRPSLWSESPVL